MYMEECKFITLALEYIFLECMYKLSLLLKIVFCTNVILC